MFETFVDFAGLQRSRAARERRLPEEFKPHLKRTPRYADRRSFGPKTRRIGHRPVLRQGIIALAMFETFVDFGVEHCRSGSSLKIVTAPKDLK